jgi:hypothetical protein
MKLWFNLTVAIVVTRELGVAPAPELPRIERRPVSAFDEWMQQEKQHADARRRR